MQTEIKRIDCYDDSRFPKKILEQHGAFIIDGKITCGVEITGEDTAVIHCDKTEYFDELIDVFRFYTEHICKFYKESGELIKEFPQIKTFNVALSDIQPSQFYVDEDKIKAVKSFICEPNDIVVPLQKFGEKFISLDGHTRLALAVERDYKQVKGFISQSDINVQGFVAEAQKRGVFTPYDLKALSHADYDVLWNKFCDDFFAQTED